MMKSTYGKTNFQEALTHVVKHTALFVVKVTVLFNEPMIVNYITPGWQICAHWKKDLQPRRWVDTLIATAEHDDVYNELENDDLLGENGGPVNFRMTTFRKAYCDKLLDMAITKSRYIALLVARHIRFVYGKEQTAKAYCRELKKKERVWLLNTKATIAEIEASYDLLQFCDAFSLLLCQGLVPPEQRRMEISKGPDGRDYQLYGTGEHLIKVAPWPFEQPSFTVSYESRTLTQLVFPDLASFKKMVQEATVHFHEMTIMKG